jgi:S1-C subfamily serine protease
LVGPDGAETDVSRWAIGLSDDLALLVPEKPPSKSVVHLASKDPVSGDLVASVGFPLGGKLTTRKARVLQRVAHPSLSSTFVLSTTASVSPGDSGGVLVDSKGDVVAVTTAVALKDDVTLAIPVSRVLDLIDRVPPFHASPICG